MNDCTVVKVGGSLFDLPDLRDRLCRFFASLDADRVLIVPGGGATADAIRALDRLHHLGEEASHWLAIRALSVNACFLSELLEAVRVSPVPGYFEGYFEGEGGRIRGPQSLAYASGSDGRLLVLDPLPFFQTDESNADHLPHDWNVTSDSLAVRAAALVGARELVLLKSVAWEGCNWQEAMRAQIVDGYFAQALASAPASLRVRIINLRKYS